MGSFIMATPSSALTTYQLHMAPAATQLTANPDPSPLTLEQQQQMQLQHQQHMQQLSPNSATSSGGESCSTPGHTTPGGTATVLTQDGQSMMIQASNNVSPQLLQIAQPSQQLYMPMQAAVQQPRVVAVRTPQGQETSPPPLVEMTFSISFRWYSTLHRISHGAVAASATTAAATTTAASIYSAQRSTRPSHSATDGLFIECLDSAIAIAAATAANARCSTSSSTAGCHAAIRRCYLPSELGGSTCSRSAESTGHACRSIALRAQMSRTERTVMSIEKFARMCSLALFSYMNDLKIEFK